MQLPNILTVKLVMPLSTRIVCKTNKNLQEIDFAKPIIIAANHQNFLDPFVIVSFMPLSLSSKLVPLCFMTANSYYFSPMRPLAYLLGCFPARKNKQNVAYGINGAVEKIHNGYALCMFPEGKRTLPGETPAKPGIKVIMDKVEDYNLILVRLHWSRLNKFRRQLTLSYKLVTKEFKDAQAILDAVYRV